MLFGDSNAKHDDLLDDCYLLPAGLTAEQTIVVGKWGVGKTAFLLQRNKDLNNFLYPINPPINLMWYLEETGFDILEMASLAKTCDNNEALLRRALEAMWKAEILRAMGCVLTAVYDRLEIGPSPHWNHVTLISRGEEALTPLWGLAGGIAAFLTGKDASALEQVRKGFSSFFKDRFYDDIQLCLIDLRGRNIHPVIAVEPIDSPESELETSSSGVHLAELLVRSLLNAYRSYFIPSSRQHIRVQLSIPWHRYRPARLDQPQHLAAFVGNFRWKKSTLREFIHLRIKNEFKRVGRRYVDKGPGDAWDALFVDRVQNNHCAGKVFENAFAYLLRHSHYRPRDIQRLAREAVRHYSVYRKTDIDSVLMGRADVVIEKTIKAAVRKEAHQVAEERVTEAQRRYGDTRKILEALRGLSIPCEADEILGRLKAEGIIKAGGKEFTRILERLWSCGFIGLEFLPLNDDGQRLLDSRYGNEAKARHYSGGRERERTFVFEHITQRPLTDLMNQFRYAERESGEAADVSTLIVLHPMMFEYLSLNPTHDYPIGI